MIDDALTPKMIEVLNALREQPMVRLDDGSWAHADWAINGKPYYHRQTVHGLVTRGLAEYTEFRRGWNGQVPMEVSIKAPARSV